MSDNTTVDQYTQAPFFSVARVTVVGNLVVNVEICNQDWLDAHRDGDGLFYFVPAPDRDGNDPVTGLRYDPSTGLFEQREKFPDDPELVKQAKAEKRKKS